MYDTVWVQYHCVIVDIYTNIYELSSGARLFKEPFDMSTVFFLSIKENTILFLACSNTTIICSCTEILEQTCSYYWLYGRGVNSLLL